MALNIEGHLFNECAVASLTVEKEFNTVESIATGFSVYNYGISVNMKKGESKVIWFKGDPDALDKIEKILADITEEIFLPRLDNDE